MREVAGGVLALGQAQGQDDGREFEGDCSFCLMYCVRRTRPVAEGLRQLNLGEEKPIVEAMKRLTSLVAILVLLYAAAPVMACVVGGTVSNEQSACCRAMHDDCGPMAGTGCCRPEVRTDDQPQLAAHLLTPLAGAEMFVAGWISPASVRVAASVTRLFAGLGESPPPRLSLVERTTQLRI